MKLRMLTVFSFVMMLTVIGHSQSVEGTYYMTGVNVDYFYVARDSSSAADSIKTYDVTASWPSSAAAAAGQGYTHVLKTFSVGDTMATPVAPFVTPELLKLAGYLITGDPTAVGIELTVTLSDAGTMLIQGTYPTTGTENCSTSAVIAPVQDNATWSFGGDPVLDEATHTATWGYSIILSGIFASFSAPPNIADPSTYGVGTDMPNWGRMIAHYTDDWSAVKFLQIYWEAHDGTETTLGVDDDNKFDRHLGVSTADGDTVTVAALKAAADAGLYSPVSGLYVGTHPIIGGEGVDTDGDGVNEGVVKKINRGYLFDPKGDDGVLFSGDEGLQFTGYYFTHNFLVTASAFKYAFTVAITGDPTAASAALQAGADSVARAFGLPAATAAAVAAGVATTLYDQFTTLVAGGMSTTDALTAVAKSGPTTVLGALVLAGVTVDDSDHDIDLTNLSAGGRLLFEIGNNCIPNNATQLVSVAFGNVDSTIAIDSDESLVPKKFALHDNYPNPFNPITQIGFELPKQIMTEVSIWNVLGQKIRTLHSGELAAGIHTLTFDGTDDRGTSLGSAVYFYRIEAGDFQATKKMILLK